MLSTKVAHGDARGERRRSGNETHGPTSQRPVTCPLCHAIPGANLAFPLTLCLPSFVSFLLASLSLLTSFPLKPSWKCLQERRVRSACSAWLATVWKEMLSPWSRSRPGTVLCRELAGAFAFQFSPAFVERKASSFGNKGLLAQNFGYTSTWKDQNIPDANSFWGHRHFGFFLWFLPLRLIEKQKKKSATMSENFFLASILFSL